MSHKSYHQRCLTKSLTQQTADRSVSIDHHQTITSDTWVLASFAMFSTCTTVYGQQLDCNGGYVLAAFGDNQTAHKAPCRGGCHYCPATVSDMLLLLPSPGHRSRSFGQVASLLWPNLFNSTFYLYRLILELILAVFALALPQPPHSCMCDNAVHSQHRATALCLNYSWAAGCLLVLAAVV